VEEIAATEETPITEIPRKIPSFEMGGHVRDMSLPHAGEMRYAGMTWVKVQIRYPQDASDIITAAHVNGFKIQLTALGTSEMVSQPNFQQDFSSWVAGLAAADADAIEVWNEPNIEAEWALGHISPEAYTSLLCAAYSAIKEANPSTLVISAAVTPTGYFGGCGPDGCDDIPFLEGMYAAGAAQCMDYIGAHHNAGATAPSARSGHPADSDYHYTWYFLPQTESYYQAFEGTRQVFYTEMGYASQEGVPEFSDDFGWARGIDNAQQANWLAEAAQLSIDSGMVRCIIVWNIDFVRYGHDPQDGYAIIRPDGSCPACDTLHETLFPQGWVFADEIRLDQKALPHSLGILDPDDPSQLGTITPPTTVQISLGWDLLVQPSANWTAFIHLVDETGALIAQSDVPLDPPAQPCKEGVYEPACRFFSQHELELPGDAAAHLCTIEVGVYDRETGERALITNEPGNQNVATLGQVNIAGREADVTEIPQTDFQWPITPHDDIKQAFHDPRNPDHLALDIAAKQGTSILAADDGTVTFSGWDDRGLGNLVVVEHADGWLSLYAHLEKTAVEIGQEVQQGDVLGTAGATGWSTGPHLHFELHHWGQPVDPIAYLPED
jgi:hypothetical protein